MIAEQRSNGSRLAPVERNPTNRPPGARLLATGQHRSNDSQHDGSFVGLHRAARSKEMSNSVCPMEVRQVESSRHWQIIVPCHFPFGESKKKRK